MTIARQFFRSLIDHGKPSEWTVHGNLAPLFKADEVDFAKFFGDFVAKHGKFPSLETFKLETGEDLPLAPDPPSYYRDRFKIRHREMEVKRVLADVHAMTKGSAPWSDQAISLMRKTLLDLNAIEHSAHMVDLREAGPLVLAAYGSKQAGTDAGLMLGWPTLDGMSGGLRLGDMVSIAGRPGVGKTWAMLHASLAGYLEADQQPDSPGSPRMFVSMEMDTLMLAQ